MIAILPVVLGSSLLGSIHCVAMCGPLAGMHGGARTLRLAAVHSLGRLATYASIGAAAGLVGRAIDLATVQRGATIVAAIAIVAMAIRMPRGTGAAFKSGLVKLHARRPAARAWLLGLLTGLLPCGWLWAFAITAAGTGSVVGGIAVMTAFWLGTVPAMLGVLALLGPVIEHVRARMPVITSVVLVVLGLSMLAMRWQITMGCHCHG